MLALGACFPLPCSSAGRRFAVSMTRLNHYQHLEARPAAPHCNTLQHTATHCNTLQLEARHTAPHCNTLQHTATHCNALQLEARHTAPHRNTLQHTATHCNLRRDTLHHTVWITIDNLVGFYKNGFDAMPCKLNSTGEFVFVREIHNCTLIRLLQQLNLDLEKYDSCKRRATVREMAWCLRHRRGDHLVFSIPKTQLQWVAVSCSVLQYSWILTTWAFWDEESLKKEKNGMIPSS